MELIALKAVQILDTSQLTEEIVRDGFVTSLELLLQVISGDLKLYWVDNYPEYSIQFENHDGPIVMDPFDPTNNLAGLLQIQDWRPLSQLAEQTLIAIRDHNLVQRDIHITPTTEQSVSAISPQYRFSCSVLRAEQLMRAGNLEEALDALAAASQIDSSNAKLKSMWHECIKQLFDEEREAKRSSLTEDELLLRLKDAVADSERVSLRSGVDVNRLLKEPDFITKDMGACEEMDIPFSTYMRSCDEADSDSSEEDIPRMVKLFPDASEDKLYTPITSVVCKSSFNDGMYKAWLILKKLTDMMPSKEQRDMYTRASVQTVLAHDALRVGKDIVGLDRMAASILATAQTTVLPELHALALAAAKGVKMEASSEMQVLPHCGLSLQVAASIVHVRMHMMSRAWAEVREALKPLLERDDLGNRADVCHFIGSSLVWTDDRDAAIPWFKRGIAADQTFRINLWALGHAMIHARSTEEADPEQKSHIMKTAEKHLWQYIEQGVPEDKKRSDALYELVYVAVLSSNFQEAHQRLEMAIEADIRRTEIYNQPSDNSAKQFLLLYATTLKQVTEAMQKDKSNVFLLFLDTLRTKLCGNSLLIAIDRATQLESTSRAIMYATKEYYSQTIATSFWSGESELAATIVKDLVRISDDVVDSKDDVNKKVQRDMQKCMQQIVVDCEGSGEFLSLGEALRSGCVSTGTVITIKGGTYKEDKGLLIKHEYLTVRAENSKEKVVIQSYAGTSVIGVEANHVTLSGLSVDILSPKGYDGVKELRGHAVHIRAGTAVVLENCSATSATSAAIVVGNIACSNEIEVTMVMCNARSCVGNAIICAGSRTQLQLQQCYVSHSRSGLEVRMGATARVSNSTFSRNENAGVLVWHHASAETVIGPDNIIQDNQGSGAILSARGIVFHHNKVTGNKLYGVTVEADPAPGFKYVNVKVKDCEISQNGLGGVQFSGGTCGVISGCCIKENNQCGIMVGWNVEKMSITGNRIQGNYSLQETGITMLGRAKVADDNEFSNNRMTSERAIEIIKLNKQLQKRQASKRHYDHLMSKQMAPHQFGRLQCAKCGAEGGPRKMMVPCVKCNDVVYCSTQCLQADADHHRTLCVPVPFYETIGGKEITFDAEHVQHMQAEQENEDAVCANCNARSKEEFKKCARCMCAAYCSKECQIKHWPVHKTVCCKSSTIVLVKATTQNPYTSKRGADSMYINTYMGPDGNVVTRIGDPVGVFQLSTDVVPMVIKIQGNEDDLIKKETFLHFYNKDRSVNGWIKASMNNSGKFKDAYTLICDTILQFGDAGRLSGKKGYFEAVVQRNMEVKVNCGNLVTENIEW